MSPAGRVAVWPALALATLVLACAPGPRPVAGASPAHSVEYDPALHEDDWLRDRGFDHRRDDALLHLDRSEIRGAGRPLAEVIARHPRIERLGQPGGASTFLLHPEGGAGAACALEVRINGVPSRRLFAARRHSTDQVVSRRTASGVEVHSGATSPVGHPDDCGVLIIWSHELRRAFDTAFTGELRGTVTAYPDRSPLDGLDVTLSPGGLETATDRYGEFHFPRLVAGRYELVVGLSEVVRWEGSVRVRSGGLVDMEVEVEVVEIEAPGRRGAP